MRAIRLILAAAFLSLSVTGQAQVSATYAPLKTEKYVQAAAAFQRIGLLEKIADSVNSNVRLPTPVMLVGQECGTSNAFYAPGSRSIFFCYELMETIVSGVTAAYPKLSGEQSIEIAVGAIMFVVNHEVGHALVDILKLPIFAREEDTADAIASYFQLRSRNPMPAVIGAHWFFGRGGQEFTSRHYSSEHSLGPQRQANILCFAAGSNREGFAALAARFGLPEERARRCGAEYQKLEASVFQLLGRYVVR